MSGSIVYIDWFNANQFFSTEIKKVKKNLLKSDFSFFGYYL
jgi:hypothetical protein